MKLEKNVANTQTKSSSLFKMKKTTMLGETETSRQN